MNEQMKIIKIDDAFEQMTGYTRKDIEEHDLHQADLIFPEERMEYACLVAEQEREGEAAYFAGALAFPLAALIVSLFGALILTVADRRGEIHRK